ncbi:uncharacterized protein LOC131946109 [Physella acuta]|uniref:uncharacterized protein LOC131946109 n=1 Tax=Physella acuta TaxID=109671 RepID=UPI0027DD99E9|nr:uncharacterized protein LOC131946109 [Physella acuta]
MRPRIHVKLVAVHMKYLEEQLGVIEPVIDAVKSAVGKSKSWIDDTSDEPSISYCELYQELEAATSAIMNAAAQIISEPKDDVDVDDGISSSSSSTTPTTATLDRGDSTHQVKLDRGDTTYQVTKQVQQTAEILTRLARVERTLSSLQDSREKTTDPIERLEQHIREQDEILKQLNKELESLKDVKPSVALQKMTLDVKEFENNLHKINCEMKVFSDQIYNTTQDVKNNFHLINALKDGVQQNMAITTCKFNDVFAKLETQANDSLRLSAALTRNEVTEYKPYICQIHLDNNTPVSTGSIISTFYNIWEPDGSHFNRTTGKLVAPEDGFYLVLATLEAIDNKIIRVSVLKGDVLQKDVFVNCANTSACGSTLIDMKKGDELSFKVTQADQGAMLSGPSGFTIVKL